MNELIKFILEEDITNTQTFGNEIREIRHNISEVKKRLIKMTELRIETPNIWKRSTKHINKIREEITELLKLSRDL